MATQISAIYVDSSHFLVAGDHEGDLTEGRKILLLQGVGGQDTVSVVASVASAGSTNCQVTPATVVSTLATIELGPTDRLNTGLHSHLDNDDGGLIPAATMSTELVEVLKTIPVPTASDWLKFVRASSTTGEFELVDIIGSLNQLVGVNAAGTDLESKTIQGTSNQVTVTHDANLITLSTPQNIHAEATNFTVAGATISGLTGIIQARAASPVEAVEGAEGTVVYRGTTKWEALEISLKHLADVAATVTDSGASGDLIVRGASIYDRLAKGTWGQSLVIKSDGNVGWDATGDIQPITAGEALAQYDTIYSDTADSGKWKKARADGTDAEADIWAMVLKSGGIPDDASGEVIFRGFVTNESWTWTPGATLFLSDTAGGLSESPGVLNRTVAKALTATKIYFGPERVGFDSTVITTTTGAVTTTTSA